MVTVLVHWASECWPDQSGFAAWSLLFYALWHREHIQRRAPERDVFQTLSTAA